MALQPIRMEYRLRLAHVDRGLEREETLIVGRHPSETGRHLTLRVLAWCLFCEEGLTFGPGLSDPDSAALWTHDLTGRITRWIVCGAADVERLRRVVQGHAGAAVQVLLDDSRRAAELVEEIAAARRKGLERVALATVDTALVQALAAREERRQKWTVTVVGDHLYVEADGVALDGAVTRVSGA